MRWLPLLLLAVIVLPGCPPRPNQGPPPPPETYEWRDIYSGNLKSVGGFGDFLEVQFEDDIWFKLPYTAISGGDPWRVGDMVALQDKKWKTGSGPVSIINHSWRFRAVRFSDPNSPVLPAEKGPVTK